ncbi:MAG: transposase-like protein [Alteromonadaceae bacterium]|jgi:transposase-like protein
MSASFDTKGFRITKELLVILSACGQPIDAKKLEILERVLVNGESQPNIAKEFGVSQQYVSKCVKGIYQRLTKQFANLPAEFVVRTIALHPSLLDELQKLQEKSYKLLNK